MPRRKHHQTLEDLFPVVLAEAPSEPQEPPWIPRGRLKGTLKAGTRRPDPDHSPKCPHCILATFGDQVRVSLRRDLRIKTIQPKVKATIRRIAKAAEDIESLHSELLSLAYSRPRDLYSLPRKLRTMVDELERARLQMLPGKKPFFDTALANLVALVWERTGSPRHELVAAFVGKLASFGGYESKAHEKWVERHGALISREREWVRKLFPIPSDTR